VPRGRKKGRRAHNTGTVAFKRDGRLRPYFAVLNITREQHGKRSRERHWSKGFEFAEDAERELRRMLDDHGLSDPSAANDATVGSIVPDFIDAREGEHSPTTTQRYHSLYDNNLAELASVKITALDDSILAPHYARLRKRGSLKKGTPLSATSIHHADALLRTACAWAKRTKRATINPFHEHEPEKPTRKSTPFQALTVADAENFLKHIDGSQRGENGVLLAFATGMRRGEIIGLRTRALDMSRGILTVREARYKITGKQDQKRPKTNQNREIPLNALALQALKQEHKRQGALRKQVGDAWEDSGFVFTGDWGQPLPVDAIYTAFRAIAKRAKLTGYTLHSLRHTVATWMLADGVDLQTAKAILGHSRASTILDTYAHLVPGRGLEAVKIMDRKMGAKPPKARKAARR